MSMFEDLQRGLAESGTAPGQPSYCVDIVMCIDATGSMGPIIREVRESAMRFGDRFRDAMKASGKNVDALRVRVIAFRDYITSKQSPMAQSPFFSLPEDSREFHKFVEGVKAKGGGGDGPENALEALALAMRSDWTSEGTKQRHVILVFTDASAVPLRDPSRTSNPSYPADMPDSLADLGDMWAGESQELGGMPSGKSARLVLFAPSTSPWTDIQVWNNVWAAFSPAGKGLEDVDIDLAIQLLVNSVK